MTGLTSILTAIGFSGIVGALIAAWTANRTLKANRPITDAQADERQAQANATNLETSQELVTALRQELNDQVARSDRRIAAQEKRIESLEFKVEVAEEQEALLIKQNEALQDEKRTLNQHLAECRRNGRVLSQWVHDHYAVDHPGQDAPPMPFT